MEDLGEHLCELIRHAVDAAEPEASLCAIAALHEDLRAFERAQVARALRRGASFADVARALGISRQAAHRRYRDVGGAPDPASAPAGSSERRGRILITSEARAAVRLAREEASALGASAVGTEHLLLGILRFGDPHAAQALQKAGIDVAVARMNAQGTLADGSFDGVPEGPRGISPNARAVFEQSLREALARGDGYIGVEHLLIATLHEEQGGANRTLQAVGVDPAAVVARL